MPFRFLTPEGLREATEQFGPLIYLVLFALFLFQTGFLIGPVIPGNPLVFVAGLLANPKNGNLNLVAVIGALGLGVFLGNLLNYAQGKAAGPAFRNRERWRAQIENAEGFFERHGGRTVALATFVPFIRAFVPFVAGMSQMEWRRFAISSAVGAFGWIAAWSVLGYQLGHIPAVQQNSTKIVFGIVAVVGTVALIKALQMRFRRTRAA
jgi:membrane-associated protein